MARQARRRLVVIFYLVPSAHLMFMSVAVSHANYLFRMNFRTYEQSVFESLITIEYVDAIANPPTENLRLVPSDPYLAAKCRYWADKVNREACSPYYGVLVRIDEKERMENFQKLLGGLKAFSKEVEKSGGKTFLGGGRLSNTDVALMPW